MRYVTAHTRPTDSVMVWGNMPELYWRAERRPGGALVHSDFVTGRSGGRPIGSSTLDDAIPGALDRLLEALATDPPRLVVDTSTADIRGYDAYPMPRFPRLAAFVEAHYTRVAKIDGVVVWERSDPEPRQRGARDERV